MKEDHYRATQDLGPPSALLGPAFYRFLKSRRMCRAYRDLPLRPSVVERIVDAGSWAPAAGNSRGIHWLVLQDSQRRREVAHLAGEEQWVEKGYPAWLSQAAVHMICILDRSAYLERYQQTDKAKSPLVREQQLQVDFPMFDAGAATMAVLLAAEAEGLGAGFMGAHNLPGLGSLLMLPLSLEIVGLITVGHPHKGVARVASPRSKHRQQTQHWETWGQTS